MGWVYNASPEVEALSRYHTILAVCISLTVVMVLVVGLRLGLRLRLGRFDASDYVMVFAMIFSIVYNALCIARKSIVLSMTYMIHPYSYNNRKPLWTGITAGVTAKGEPADLHKGT
jgi:hypothetical protein